MTKELIRQGMGAFIRADGIHKELGLYERHIMHTEEDADIICQVDHEGRNSISYIHRL